MKYCTRIFFNILSTIVNMYTHYNNKTEQNKRVMLALNRSSYTIEYKNYFDMFRIE